MAVMPNVFCQTSSAMRHSQSTPNQGKNLKTISANSISITMKARQFIGGFLAIIGVTAAVSVCDGSAYETLIRGIGVAMAFTGVLIGKFFSTKRVS